MGRWQRQLLRSAEREERATDEEFWAWLLSLPVEYRLQLHELAVRDRGEEFGLLAAELGWVEP